PDTSKPSQNSHSRRNPFSATLLESRPLNKTGSAKDTRHVVIDLVGSNLQYDVGDALGIFPTNCPDLATAIINHLAADPTMKVETASGTKKSLLEVIVQDHCLKDPSDELIELLASRAESPPAKQALTAMASEGAPEGTDVLDVLQLSQQAPITVTEFVETLGPLNPRLYSIASSARCVGTQVHLTVGRVDCNHGGRTRKGVASTMLADRVTPGSSVRVFIQPNHGGFTIPPDPAAPMVMVGPGTGIAPFIAFLQERQSRQCSGKNWLFFGDQHQATDFLYQQELQQFADAGILTRLDTAFSRDGDQKVYVQDRMRDNAAELWDWLQQGAYFFVCGDASRMARDVDQALVEIVAQQAGWPPDQASRYVADLKDSQRYVRDVY
ncbi:MAG: sulfite reductase subunit alpha, partial [Pirellulales bacterium]|nr:sulfite reductase subunit alpha [Pirellulales bacterium]